MHSCRLLAFSAASFRWTRPKMAIFHSKKRRLATFGMWFGGFWNFWSGNPARAKQEPKQKKWKQKWGCAVFEFECRLEAEDVMGDLNPYQVIPRDLTNNPGRQKTSSRYTK